MDANRLVLPVSARANALVSGAALGACGLVLQTLFRNPLADPFVLGSRNRHHSGPPRSRFPDH
jgi:iron complex transport system permease protein